MTRNVGHTRNKGIELNLSSTNINTNNFRWTTDLSFTKNTEAIVELYNGKVDDLGNRWFIGQPLNTYFDYKKSESGKLMKLILPNRLVLRSDR